MNTRIYLSPPHLGGGERALVQDAFDSNWVAPIGPHVDGFEKELAARVGAEHVVALSSGTAAIHLALILAGVGPGDDVLCSTFTFAGSCNPIVYLGATPVFVDSERTTWNMDPHWLEKAILERSRQGRMPKAMIVVHLYGMPAQMEPIRMLADRYGIVLIEDAAEALGSTWNGRQAGSLGDLGVLSFNGNKIITTSGGGALITRDAVQAAKARFLATQARDPAPHYEHSAIGYNYRLSNISAAIGRAQLSQLSDRVRARREIFRRYSEGLQVHPGISFQPEQPGSLSNRWLTTLLIDPKRSHGVTREDLRLSLEKENIESRPLWKPMHLQPVYRDAPYFGEAVSDQFFDTGLCLPSGSNLSVAEQDRVMATILKTLQAG